MTKPTKLNIISKLNNFSNIQVGEAPTTFYDDNMYPLLYNKYGAVSLQKNDETYLSFTNDTAKLSYMQVIDSIKTKNIQLDCTILLTQIRTENILYAFVQGINNLFFKISIKNTFRDGIIITSNNMTISANYKFEANKKYNISISKEDDTYTFYINGISHGYKISPAFTNNILAGQNLTFGSNTGTTNTSTSNFRGNLYNLNISYGVTLINYKNYTKYGNNLISRQYFGNHNRVDTATLFYCNTETVNESPIIWEIPQINNKEEYAVLNNSLFKTKLNGPYTITFNFKPNNVSQTSNLFTYNNYRIILNIVIPVSPDPDVTVNEYTTSALNFENGLVDQIGTTVWTKEGTSDITSVNKIFGENSFETKTLGDGLYTNSNVITGRSAPFTIEGYYLFRPDFNTTSTGTDLSLFSLCNDSGYYQGYFLSRSSMNIGTYRAPQFSKPILDDSFINKRKIKVNEINKITISYDGSALRSFINDELDGIYGTSVGLEKSSQPLRLMSYNFNTSKNTTSGLIDNINIHDGIATKVRNHDPYEEFLVVDLAFDGENNSNRIVDNCTKPYAHLMTLYYPFNNSSYDGSATGTITIQNDTSIFGDSCAYFNSGYITHTSSEKFNLASKDFTIKVWVKFDSSYSNSQLYPSIIAKRYSGTDWDWGIEANMNNKIINFVYNKQQYIGIGSITLDTWMHICVTCKNGVLRTFCNGVLVNTANLTGTIAHSTANVLVGRTSTSWSDNYYKGFMKDLTLINGYCEYVSSFDLPTSSEIFNRWSVNGNAKISTDQKFDGFSSLYVSGGAGNSVATNFNEFFRLQNSTLKFDVILSSIPTTGNQVNFISSWNGYNNKRLFYFIFNNISGTTYIQYGISLDGTNNTGMSNFLQWQWIPVINRKYSITLIVKDDYITLYIDGISLGTMSNTLGYPSVSQPDEILIGAMKSNTTFINGLNGYLKNFKIYKGVAVIPEDPTGKIQLDFDNNVIDKYGNSTWSNNGVTFDQVNSVKGSAAYFDSSNNGNQLYSNTELLNFENKNFSIELDYKTVNNTKQWSSLIVPQNHSYPSQHVEFSTWNSNTLVFENLGSVNKTITGTNTVLNQYYNAKLIRNNNCVYITQNNVITGMGNYATNDIVNFNISNNCTIGGVNDNKFGGYIDNFKTYKEDFLNDLDIYKTNNSCTVSVDGGMLRLYSVASNGVWFKNKDCPYVKNFIFKTTIVKMAGEQSIILRTSNWSNVNDTFAYLVVINDATIGLAKGSNSLTTGSFSWLKSVNSLDPNLTKYNIEIVANDTNIKIYCNNALYIDYTGSDYLNSGLVGFRSYGASNYKIEYYSIEDLDNNLLYRKDWKSRIDNVIDKPAVHLPLETNAINTGFTPLTINSVGNPTYTTIDGKKCIKFESGKYLTINSNNIFNLGASSDFYIEFDFYIIDTSVLNVFLSNYSSFTNNSLCILYANKKIEFQFNNGTLKIYPTINTCEIGQFNNFKLRRINDKIYMNLNGIETVINENYNINFSISNLFLGKSGWSSTDRLNGYMSNFKMFVGTSEIPESYNDKKVLDLDFKPTGKSYLFKDNNNKCVIHPVNITQRDYQDSQYCCTFNGTNQYLQLGKNDLFNFGLDDFVIYFKVRIDNITPSNKDDILLSNNISWATGYIGIGRYRQTNKLSIGVYGTPGYNSSNTFNLGINDIIITRNGSNLTINLNGIETVFDNFTASANFNGNNSTRIGMAWDAATETFFSGIIYSIKVLRNTTDISLLEDENTDVIDGETSVSYTLSNGFDEVSISKDTITEKSIQIVKDTNKVTAIIDDEILEVPTTSGNVDTNDLYLFNEYKGNIKDLRVYNKAFYDKDVFEYVGPYDTELGLIDTLDNEYEEYIMVDQGNYIIKGYFEGIAEPHKWRIYNSINYNVLISGTSINYYYDGVDPLYKDDYKILDMVTNKTYDIVDMGPPGSIKVFINSKVCTGSNFVIRAYRRDSGVFIGEYELDKTRDPYECTIHNLDTTKTYDIMLFDKNNNIESRVMSNRSPDAY